MRSQLKIFAVNPGSTSTKIAYFEDLSCSSSCILRHDPQELSGFSSIMEQLDFRKQGIFDYIKKEGIELAGLSATVGRGGLLKPLKGGTYRVNSAMLEDLAHASYGEHASNLGAIIACELAASYGAPSFVVNPVVVDEMWPPARYSGLAGLQRKSVFHALNHKTAAMRAARQLGKGYGEVNLVVAHLGGGISVAAHHRGNVVDVSNGLEEGPFSPERTGNLPVLQLAELCFRGDHTAEEMKKQLVGKGGLTSYLGSSDCQKAEKAALTGDKEALTILEAMSYQIAKEIGAYGAVLSGDVDAVVITGGLAHSSMITGLIGKMVGYMAPVMVFPGEDEMLAMAEGVYRVLTGAEEALEYINRE